MMVGWRRTDSCFITYQEKLMRDDKVAAFADIPSNVAITATDLNQQMIERGKAR